MLIVNLVHYAWTLIYAITIHAAFNTCQSFSITNSTKMTISRDSMITIDAFVIKFYFFRFIALNQAST